MTSKGSKNKKNYPELDEEKDMFLSFINKKARNNVKKLKDVEDLEKRENLNTDQKKKIQAKGELLEVTKYYNEVKDLYYQAAKVNQEDGGDKQTISKSEGKTSSEDQVLSKEPQEPKQKEKSGGKDEKQQAQAQAQAQTQVTGMEQQIRPMPVSHDIKDVLNLIHFTQVFMDPNVRQEFDREYLDLKIDLDDYPDFDIIFEFHRKIFTFSESSKYDKVESKIAQSLYELELYLNSADQPALRNRNYKYLHDTVKTLIKTHFFKDKQADIGSTPPANNEIISVIGVELTTQKKGMDPTPHVQKYIPHDVVIREPGQQNQTVYQHQHPQQPNPVQNLQHGTSHPAKTQPPLKETPQSHANDSQKHTKEESKRSPQEDPKDWANLEDDDQDETWGEEEERQLKQDTLQVPAKNSQQDEWAEVKAKYRDRRPDEPQGGYRGGRAGRRGGNRGGNRAFAGDEGERGGYRGGYRGGNRGDREQGGENTGEQGDETREHRGGYRGGRGGNRGGQDGDNAGEEGGFRRGGYRGGRGGYRGGQEGDNANEEGEFRRGGYRGNRGGEQREHREGYRGGRGGNRGGQDGDNVGEEGGFRRGGYRGNRGGYRGGQEGGERGEFKGPRRDAAEGDYNKPQEGRQIGQAGAIVKPSADQ